MRVNINLASQKYEDVRQFYVRWGAVIAMLAILAVLLTTLSYLKYSRSTASARETKDLQQKIGELEKQRDQLAAIDNRPENRDVTQRKKFWNTQIARRSFWLFQNFFCCVTSRFSGRFSKAANCSRCFSSSAIFC